MTISHAPPPPGLSVAPEKSSAPSRTPPDLEVVVPASVRRSRLRSAPRWVRRAVGPLLLLALWQVFSATGVLHPDVLASPGTIARAGADLVADGTLPAAMGVSLQRVVVGLLLGGVVGTALALVSGLSRLGEDLVDATVQMLRTVPWVGLIPLFIIWLGIGEAPKVALIALGVAFHLYLNVYAGIRGVDAQLIEAGESLGLGRWGLVRHVVLPGALPGAMTGLRYSLATAWLALVFGESINADAGIGFLMNQAREFFRTDVIVVCLVVYAFLGLTADVIVRILERLLLQWRPTFTGQ
ncbi:ABC transporter permease [Streptomyces anulatus]|uniref:ABC transporter permease n=1 Tax=Streptomyces TaxID=1883 RepID=UPI000ACCAEA3|nr:MULTISPECIES: ABC transporter permease [Streptomyces]MBQ1107024.1 ABC transporter permease [Streptomyces sp. 404i]MBQ1115105.1 ABC transporter permease [Streptomyces sp. C3-3]MDX3489114.1 ABC transporter permease [Streptomyces sp. ID05-18]WIY74836.1 ABC transporter permease [Streptomyces anulatus]